MVCAACLGSCPSHKPVVDVAASGSRAQLLELGRVYLLTAIHAQDEVFHQCEFQLRTAKRSCELSHLFVFLQPGFAVASDVFPPSMLNIDLAFF